MIKGVDVEVSAPTYGTKDRFGNSTVTYGKAETVNVLIVPGATDLLEASRPEGATVAYTLHFPKTYTASLEGCIVTLPQPWGGTYAVLGDPKPYIDENVPGQWDRPVEVEAVHG